MFQASILVGGGSVINGVYPVYFLPLGRDGVTIMYDYIENGGDEMNIRIK